MAGYNFGLSPEDEARAQRLHDDNIVIDLLFQGPLSPTIISDETSERLRREAEPLDGDPEAYAGYAAKQLGRMSAAGMRRALPPGTANWTCRRLSGWSQVWVRCKTNLTALPGSSRPRPRRTSAEPSATPQGWHRVNPRDRRDWTRPESTRRGL